MLFAQREADRQVLEIRRRGEHHHMRHAVISQRDRHFFGDLIADALDLAVAPALEPSLHSWSPESCSLSAPACTQACASELRRIRACRSLNSR